MERFGELAELEPADLIELVRLTVTHLASIKAHLEIKRDPMRLFPTVLPMHVPVPEEFVLEHISAQLFPYLLTQGLLNRVMELERATATIPGTVFIAAVRTALLEEIIPLPIMAEVSDGHSHAIDALSHATSIAL